MEKNRRYKKESKRYNASKVEEWWIQKVLSTKTNFEAGGREATNREKLTNENSNETERINEQRPSNAQIERRSR